MKYAALFMAYNIYTQWLELKIKNPDLRIIEPIDAASLVIPFLLQAKKSSGLDLRYLPAVFAMTKLYLKRKASGQMIPERDVTGLDLLGIIQ
jgi:hypothetical protein